jgi:hypothetical protein
LVSLRIQGFFRFLFFCCNFSIVAPRRFSFRVRGAVRIGVFGTCVPSTTSVTQHGLTNEKDRGTYHGSIDVVDCARYVARSLGFLYPSWVTSLTALSMKSLSKVRRGFISSVDIGLENSGTDPARLAQG